MKKALLISLLILLLLPSLAGAQRVILPSERALQVVYAENGLVVALDTDSFQYHKDKDFMKALALFIRDGKLAYWDIEVQFRERFLCYAYGCIEPEGEEPSGAIWYYLYNLRDKRELWK
jgi:hypothetical protein